MSEPTNEKALVNRIVEAVTSAYPEAWWLKTHGGAYQRAGVPDLLVSIEGRLFAFEVKHLKPGETIEHAKRRVTLRQRVEIERIDASGATARIVMSVEQVLDTIDQQLKGK